MDYDEIVGLFDSLSYRPTDEDNVTVDDGRRMTKYLLTNKIDIVVFVNVVIDCREHLRHIWWLMVEGYPYTSEFDDFRQTWSRRESLHDAPKVLHRIPKLTFNQEVYDKFVVNGNFRHLPWLCQELSRQRVLWRYPEEVTQWLQHCINKIPFVPKMGGHAEGWDFWTRYGVKKRLEYTTAWYSIVSSSIILFSVSVVLNI